MKKIALALALTVAAPAAFAQFPSLPKVDTKAVEANAKVAADKKATEVKADVKAEVKEAIKVDVVDTALAQGKYTTLAAALKTADLVTALKAAGPFTIFAPDDAAFAKVPAKDLAALLADKPALTAVLKNHVVAGKITSKELKAGKVKTLGGHEVEVAMKDGKIFFGGANVVVANLDATNGVVHGIDSVILK